MGVRAGASLLLNQALRMASTIWSLPSVAGRGFDVVSWGRSTPMVELYCIDVALLDAFFFACLWYSSNTILAASRQQAAQLHACFVQLRFAVSDGASQHSRNLVMFIALNVVENKNHAVAGRQVADGPLEHHAVNRAGERQIEAAKLFGSALLEAWLKRFLKRDLGQRFFAQVHKYCVHREAMQPGGKGGLAAEESDLAIELQESFLRQILGLRVIAHHAQAQGKYAPFVSAVKQLETGHISGLGFGDHFRFRHLGVGERRDWQGLALLGCSRNRRGSGGRAERHDVGQGSTLSANYCCVM